jgi:hypothetical protein
VTLGHLLAGPHSRNALRNKNLPQLVPYQSFLACSHDFCIDENDYSQQVSGSWAADIPQGRPLG